MKNNNNKNILKSSSFTLIELIIVLAIISILVTILIATIKPTEIFKKARDSKRIADLKNIEKAIDLLYSTYPNFNELNYASTNIVYISLKDDSPTCSSYISQLPSLPPGYQYRCSANPQNIDGTGWIPIPFNNFDIINLANLPIDPINKPPYYYIFVVGGNYEVTAALEADSNRNINGPAGTDGGTSWNVYEVGSNKKLTPLVIEDGGGRDKSLVGYWPFDEGTGTIAKDYSGNGNNGTLINGPTWTTGKIGGALSFDGVDDQLYKQDPNGLFANNAPQSIVAWVNHTRGNVVESILGLTNPSLGSAIQLGTKGNNVFSVWKWGGGVLISDPNPLSLNAWTHWAYTYDGATHRLYRNGILVSSSTAAPQSAAPSLLIVSGYNINSAEKFLGSIDEVRLYNRALSDAEIKALYDATK
jgi:prepilin-type N-terminal cleavage/methylation domain-containing protein